jgi:hypothetical protein
MIQVSVYKFRKYDVMTDDYQYSTRLATREKIARIGAEIIPDSRREIDANLLDDGWTKKNFDQAV